MTMDQNKLEGTKGVIECKNQSTNNNLQHTMQETQGLIITKLY